MNLIKYVNSLKTLKRFQAVSFDMHCEIGYILDEDDATHDTTEVDERILLNSNEISFMP